ncbi:MAG: autotransporter domain-containing protein [Thermoguttaceae bacterium]
MTTQKLPAWKHFAAALVAVGAAVVVPQTFAATVNTTDTPATVNAGTGLGTNIGNVTNNDDIKFAGDHTLTITGKPGTIAPAFDTLNNITTATNGTGTLIFKLDDNTDVLTITGKVGVAYESSDPPVQPAVLKALTITRGTINVTGEIIVGETKKEDKLATLTTGMYFDGGVWKSNITTAFNATTNLDGKITFAAASPSVGTPSGYQVWYIQEAVGYTGGKLEGEINAPYHWIYDIDTKDAPVDIANKSLATGNLLTQLYDFEHIGTYIAADPAPPGPITTPASNKGYITGRVKSKANISDTIANTPIMFQPQSLYTSVVGRGYRGHEWERSASAFGTGASRLSFWTNYVGRSTKLIAGGTRAEIDGMSLITSNGVQFGADTVFGKRTIVGAMFSYERGLSVLNTSRMVGDNYSFGVYGSHLFSSGIDTLVLLGYGHQKYDSRRFDPTFLHENGSQGKFMFANLSGNTFEMTLEGGRRFRMRENMWIRPAFAIDVYNNDVGKFTEAEFGNGNGGLDFGSMSLTQAFVRGGGDIILKHNRLAMNGGFYLSHQLLESGVRVFSTTKNAADGPNVGVSGSDLGRTKLTFNVGGAYALGAREALSLFGGYDCGYFSDRQGKPWGHNGVAGVRYQF